MRFFALISGIAAFYKTETKMPSIPAMDNKNIDTNANLHEEMESFVNIVEAIETHDQDVVYEAVSARKNSLEQTMYNKDAKMVT